MSAVFSQENSSVAEHGLPVPVPAKLVEEQRDLYAHVIAVKAGGNPDRDLHTALATAGQGGDVRYHGSPFASYPYRDWLHASACMTSVMVPIARNRTMLVGVGHSLSCLDCPATLFVVHVQCFPRQRTHAYFSASPKLKRVPQPIIYRRRA